MTKTDIKKWHWAITWDNPFPADSSSMIAALSKLGSLTAVQTKTTYILSPKKGVTWHQIRAALVANLHPQKGNVVYVNMRSGKIFEWGRNTSHKWRSVV